MSGSLVVNEIYLSLQGESTWAGLPCVFVRLTGCGLRCSYCDTAYAFTAGQTMAWEDVLRQVEALAAPYPPDAAPGRLPLVELTGGEPLRQAATLPLLHALCERGYITLLETSGAYDLSGVDPRVRKIMDLKCPSSGEHERNRWANLAHLAAHDEIKFVIGTVEDYEWAKAAIRDHGLARRCPLLFSWAAPLAPHQQDPSLKPVPAGQQALTRLELVERIIADRLPVRFQLQMHKLIWSPDQRGV